VENAITNYNLPHSPTKFGELWNTNKLEGTRESALSLPSEVI